jgi:hypothetical protein
VIRIPSFKSVVIALVAGALAGLALFGAVSQDAPAQKHAVADSAWGN